MHWQKGIPMSKLIVFDLDGTLIDSLSDLAHSVNYALSKVKCPAKTVEEVHHAIGHGALKLINSCLPTDSSPELQAEAFEVFLAYYNQNCSIHTQPYQGVAETLEELKNRNYDLALLTNKPFEPTQLILNDLGLSHYFSEVLGGDSLPVRKPDPAGLWWLMGAHGVLPSETWMIGDSNPDFESAHKAGVPSIGYLSNLAMPDKWNPKPLHQVSDFKEILQLI